MASGKRLTKDCKPEPRQPPLDPLKALVRGAMSFDVPDARADEAMAVIDREFVDLNELRVATELEVQELLGNKYPAIERRAMIMTFSDHDARLRTLRILNEIEVHLGNYLLTVTVINVCVGIATGIVCAVTGMPNPAGLGALAAALNFIPIIGPVAMFVVLAVVGVVTFPTIGGGLMAALAFGGVTFMEGHFVTPTIIGRRLSLNALAVFIALAFWTWLWGPMGAFLSSPLLIVGLILKEHLMPVNSPQLPQG